MKKLLYTILILGIVIVGQSAYAVSASPTDFGGTGTTTPSGILYGDNGGSHSLNTVKIGSGCTFSGGTLACAGTGGGGAFPFTVNGWGNSTTSTLGFFNGFLSNASSTIASNLFLSSLGQGFLYTGTNGIVKSVASSSVPLSGFNNDLANLTATDGSLTFSGNYNGSVARTVGLNTGNSNTWSVLQNFNYSSSTLYSSFNTASSTNLFAGTFTLSTTSAGCASFTSTGRLFSTGVNCGSGGGGGSPGGSDTQIQFNNASSFGGSKLLYIDSATAPKMKVQDQPTNDTNGYDFTLLGGIGKGNGEPGAVNIIGAPFGNSSGNFKFGSVNLIGGTGATGLGLAGGDVNITGGTADTGNGGGGDVKLRGGPAGTSGGGGNISILAADTTAAGNTGGHVTINSGDGGANGNGGLLSFSAGGGEGSGNGGDTNFSGGYADLTGNGGSIIFGAGISGSVSGNGGNIQFLPGLSAFGSNGIIEFTNPTSNINAIFDTSILSTTDKTFTFPDKSLTFAGINNETFTGLTSMSYSSSTLYSSFNTASSTKLFAGTLTLPNITGTQCLHSVSGVVSGTGSDCGAGGGGLSSYDAFTHPYVGTSATTSTMIFPGIVTNASSTIASNLFMPGLSQGFLYTGSAGIVKAVASSSIPLSGFNNDLANLSATNASLTFSGAYNGSTAQTVGLNLGNANTWTALQSFNYSSSTIYSSFLTASTTNLIVNGSSFNNLLGAGLSNSSGALTIGTGAITNSMLAGSIDLTTKVTGILPLLNGGTATSTFYNGGVVFSDSSKLTQSSSNSNFFWDETNKRLGIGTSTPQFPLSLFSSTGSQLSLSAGGGQPQIAFRNEAGILAIASTTVDGTATSTPSAFELNTNSGVGSGMAIGSTTLTSFPGLDVFVSIASSTPLLLEAPSGGGCIILKDVAGTGYTQLYTQAGVMTAKVHTGALTSCN